MFLSCPGLLCVRIYTSMFTLGFSLLPSLILFLFFFFLVVLAGSRKTIASRNVFSIPYVTRQIGLGSRKSDGVS